MFSVAIRGPVLAVGCKGGRSRCSVWQYGDQYWQSAVKAVGPGVQWSEGGSNSLSLGWQGLRVRSPLTPTKITEKEICTGSSQDKCSRVSVLYTGHVKEPGLSSVVDLQYLALWATNRN